MEAAIGPAPDAGRGTRDAATADSAGHDAGPAMSACEPIDDGDPCTLELCSNDVATQAPAPRGTACSTGGFVCDGAGRCVECLARADCSTSGNACTEVACIEGVCTGVPRPNGTSCDDSDACTQADLCRAGACVGTEPVFCAASDACHLGVCDPLTGVCTDVAQQDGYVCDDGDRSGCTRRDACSGGICMSGELVTCDAGSVCIDGACAATECDGAFALPGPTPVPVGNYPLSVLVEDFDGDGRLDLATANYAGDDVSVVLGVGDGLFAPAVQYPVGPAPYAVAAADVDRDGDADLATANHEGDDISLLINAGDGTFAPALAFAAGPGPHELEFADLDGDSDPDLVVLNAPDPRITLLFNHGGTMFAATALDVGSQPHSVKAADLNGDGALDLVVTRFDPMNFDHRGLLTILLNLGDGTFAAPIDRGIPTGASLALADLNDERCDRYRSDPRVRLIRSTCSSIAATHCSTMRSVIR